MWVGDCKEMDKFRVTATSWAHCPKLHAARGHVLQQDPSSEAINAGPLHSDSLRKTWIGERLVLAEAVSLGIRWLLLFGERGAVRCFHRKAGCVARLSLICP